MPTHHAIPDQAGRYWPVCGDRNSPDLTMRAENTTCPECLRRVNDHGRAQSEERHWFGRKI